MSRVWPIPYPVWARRPHHLRRHSWRGGTGRRRL